MTDSKKPVLVIMAAGMGSRYGGLKQMDPMDERGHLIIDYSIYDAVRAGFEKVIFVIKEENYDLFRETIGDRISAKVEVAYAFQRLGDLPEGFAVPEGRVKPWGTGQAILSAAGAAEGAPFAVINADDYYGKEAFQKAFDYLSSSRDDDMYRFAMVGYQLKNTVTENGSVSRGVCRVSPDGFLQEIRERTRIEMRPDGIACTEDGGESWIHLDDDTIVSMNMWCFSAGIMDELKSRFPQFLENGIRENPLKCEYFLPSVVEALLKENKATVKVVTTPDKWYGVTYREDKPGVVAALAAMRKAGVYPDALLDS